MFYWLFYEKLFHLYTPFRVFQYATFRTAMASLTALLLSIVLGPWLIARLRQFQIGQHIREDGPKSHQKKAGTPTMGGMLICLSIVVPTLLWANLRVPAVWVALAGLVSFGAIGFWDDYTKVLRKRNLGLTARQKLASGNHRRASDRRAAAGDERARPLLDQHERAVLQEFQSGSADSLAAAQPVDVSARVPAVSSDFSCWCWWARPTR